MNHIQSKEQLTFVFMDAFDLNIEQHISIKFHTTASLHQPGKIFLVGPLDRPELVVKAGVVRELGEAFEAIQVGDPARSQQPSS